MLKFICNVIKDSEKEINHTYKENKGLKKINSVLFSVKQMLKQISIISFYILITIFIIILIILIVIKVPSFL